MSVISFIRKFLYCIPNGMFVISQKRQRAHLIGSLKYCGKNLSVSMPIVIEQPQYVELGTMPRETIIKKPVVIEDDVWIGAHSVILAGATVGSGAVIGAGSIVTKNVESNAIVTGVSARFFKYRDMGGVA